jgi:riboflavin kinase/FMN adenylyltransferase
MQTLKGIEGLLQAPQGAVLSIGNFDGVHLGHRRILQTARQLARANGAAQVVVTFEPHPTTVLRPGAAPPRLTPWNLKQRHLETAGADYLVVLPPVPEVLNLTAERFWEILRDEVRASHLVEGASFRFGKGAKGTIEKLRDWTAGTSVKLLVVDSCSEPLLDLQVVPVSSSLIRFLLELGRVREAAIFLGRPYLLSGEVVAGFKRGRELGFPTANLKCVDQLVPLTGVYVGRCTVDGVEYPAAVSIGTSPTFGENLTQIEAHLIGFGGDLYGRTLDVEFIDWLREQRKYRQIADLQEQIKLDVMECRKRFEMDPARPIAFVG